MEHDACLRRVFPLPSGGRCSRPFCRIPFGQNRPQKTGHVGSCCLGGRAYLFESGNDGFAFLCCLHSHFCGLQLYLRVCHGGSGGRQVVCKKEGESPWHLYCLGWTRGTFCTYFVPFDLTLRLAWNPVDYGPCDLGHYSRPVSDSQTYAGGTWAPAGW